LGSISIVSLGVRSIYQTCREKRSGLGSQNSTWSKQQPMEFQTNKVGFMNKHEDNYRTYSDLFWHTQAGHSSGILPQSGHWFAAAQKRQMKWLSTDQTKDLRDRYADCSDENRRKYQWWWLDRQRPKKIWFSDKGWIPPMVSWSMLNPPIDDLGRSAAAPWRTRWPMLNLLQRFVWEALQVSDDCQQFSRAVGVP